MVKRQFDCKCHFLHFPRCFPPYQNFKSCGEVVAVISKSCSQKRGLSISTKGIDQGHPPAQSDLSCNFLLFVNVLQVQGPMYLMVSWLSNKIEVFGSLIKTTAVTKCDLTLY